MAFEPKSLLSDFSWNKTLHFLNFCFNSITLKHRGTVKEREQKSVFTPGPVCAFSIEKGTFEPSGRAGNVPKGQPWECGLHWNPEALGSPALPSSRAPGKTLMGFKNSWREHVPSPGLPGSLGWSTGVTPSPRTSGRIILLKLGVPWLIQRYSDSSRESAQRLGDRGHSELVLASTGETKGWPPPHSHPVAPLAL